TLVILEQYAWPGNVRELENVMQRATVVCKGDVILPVDLAPEIFRTEAGNQKSEGRIQNPIAGNDEPAALARKLFQWARRDGKMKIIPAVERELIIEALNETKGN